MWLPHPANFTNSTPTNKSITLYTCTFQRAKPQARVSTSPLQFQHSYQILVKSLVKMDIDDILREVDPTSHSVPSETRDLQALTRLWIAERSAPDLLQ